MAKFLRKSDSESPHHQSSESSTPQSQSRDEVDQFPDASQASPSTVEQEKTFEVSWDVDHDPMSPRTKSKLRKWIITACVSSTSLCITMNSSIYVATYDQLIPLFNTTRLVATLGLSIFVAGLGIGPLCLAPLSEFYGRRPIYIGSLILVFIWIIPCAVAQNMATIIVTRFFDGFFGSAYLSVAGGTIGDMFEPSQLSLPMTVYTSSPMIGPALGPLVGGFINQYADWRWSFWVLLIWTGVQLALVSILVPETYHPVLLRRKAQKLRHESGNDRWQAPIEKMNKSITKTVLWSCVRPFQLLIYEPMVLNLCLYSALLLGILYLFFGAFPLIFGNNHGFDLSQTGLAFLGLFIGEACAIPMDFVWGSLRRRLQRKRELAGGEPRGSEPEYRLPPTVFGAPLVVIGLFGFAFSTYSYVHWIVPITFSGIFGLGVVTSYAGIFTFLVESYPMYAASAMAANSFARSAFAAGFPLFGVQMYTRLGYQWATAVLAFISLVMAPFPYIFFRYGRSIRKRSKFATQP